MLIHRMTIKFSSSKLWPPRSAVFRSLLLRGQRPDFKRRWKPKFLQSKAKSRIPAPNVLTNYSIHLDLLAASRIPDPFIGTNEKLVQWVHSKDWVYKCKFQAKPPQEGETVDLVFNGLDTFAKVTLNGKEILR
jgi:hypothetical protein